MTEKIQSLHACYCDATGQQIRLAFDRERAWYDFIQAGFTEADVRFLAAWLQRKIRAGERNPGALKFSNMIGQLDRLEEDLQLARAEMRNFKPAPTERDKTIRAFRPEASELPPAATAKPSKEFLASAIEQLRKAAQ